jgi:hypothetical protein
MVAYNYSVSNSKILQPFQRLLPLMLEQLRIFNSLLSDKLC